MEWDQGHTNSNENLKCQIYDQFVISFPSTSHQSFLAVPGSHEGISPHSSRAKQGSEDMMSSTESQPFLRRFSAGWVYARMLSITVEYLEKQGRYKEANDLLQCLLSQELYCTSSRGRWWERMALNLDCHLKQKEKVCWQRS